jgi:hypothetical protein
MKTLEIYNFLDSIDFETSPVPFLPTLLLSHNLPYKLIQTVQKLVQIDLYPSLPSIVKTFSSNPYKSEHFFATGILEDGSRHSITTENFYLEIQFSQFCIIQGFHESSFEKVFHKIECRSNHYNSFTMIKKNSETIINDEITIEKQLFELTSNFAQVIEKNQKTVQSLALQFFVDSGENIVFEQPYEWIFSSFIQGKGVKSVPVVFASFQKLRRNDLSRNYSNGLKPRPIQAKPRVQFKEKKYNRIKLHLSLLTFSQKMNKPVVYCNGDYCELKIKVNVKKNKRISLYLYQGLPHRTIRATALSLTYPIDEQDFEIKFKKLYLVNTKSKIPDYKPEQFCPLSLKQNNITICPICFKVYSTVRGIHLGLI